MSRSLHLPIPQPFIETAICHLTLYSKNLHHQYTIKHLNLFADGVYDIVLPNHEAVHFGLMPGEILSATIFLLQTNQKITLPVQIGFTVNRIKFENKDPRLVPEMKQLNLKFLFQNLEQRHLLVNYIRKYPQASSQINNTRPPNDMREKRKSPRYPVEWDSFCNYHHHVYSFPMQNVSLGGFQVRSEKAFLFPPFSVGEIIEFYVLHNGKKYIFKARLININDFFTHEPFSGKLITDNKDYHFLYFKLYGFRFYDVSEQAKNFLKKLIGSAAQKRNNVLGLK